MQVKFIFAFFLLGVCFIQNVNAHPLSAEERGWIEDSYEYALEKIAEVQKAITNTFYQAQVSEKERGWIEDAYEYAQEKFAEVPKAITDTFNQAQVSAEEHGWIKNAYKYALEKIAEAPKAITDTFNQVQVSAEEHGWIKNAYEYALQKIAEVQKGITNTFNQAQNINAHPLSAEERGRIEDDSEYALEKIAEVPKVITDTFNQAQNINAHPLSAEERGCIEDPYEYALEKIAEVQKTITDAFNQSRDTLNEYVRIINKQINDAIEKVTMKLDIIITEANNKIEELRKQAEEAGVNIADCIDTDQLSKLLDSLIENEKTCVTGEVDKVYAIITETMEIIDNTTVTAGALPAKVEACMKNSGTPLCLEDVASLASGLLTIPGQVAKKVTQVSEFLTELKARLEYCASLQVIKARKDSLAIVGDVSKCSTCKIAPELWL